MRKTLQRYIDFYDYHSGIDVTGIHVEQRERSSEFLKFLGGDGPIDVRCCGLLELPLGQYGVADDSKAAHLEKGFRRKRCLVIGFGQIGQRELGVIPGFCRGHHRLGQTVVAR